MPETSTALPSALLSRVDAVIVDLEDAVEHLAKASAREALCDFLGTQPQARVWVRINDASTSWHDDDLKAVFEREALCVIDLFGAGGGGQGRQRAPRPICLEISSFMISLVPP